MERCRVLLKDGQVHDLAVDRREVTQAMRTAETVPREWRTVRVSGPVRFAGGEVACLWAC